MRHKILKQHYVSFHLNMEGKKSPIIANTYSIYIPEINKFSTITYFINAAGIFDFLYNINQ